MFTLGLNDLHNFGSITIAITITF